LQIQEKPAANAAFVARFLRSPNWRSRPDDYANIALTLVPAAAVYAARPQVCRDYECLWKGDRDMSPRLRSNRTGTILMEDPDSSEYRAVCDREKPFAWLTPLVFKHLVAMAKSGRIVVAKAELKSWRIRANGQWGPCV
jgi:hypothetical protein